MKVSTIFVTPVRCTGVVVVSSPERTPVLLERWEATPVDGLAFIVEVWSVVRSFTALGQRCERRSWHRAPMSAAIDAVASASLPLSAAIVAPAQLITWAIRPTMPGASSPIEIRPPDGRLTLRSLSTPSAHIHNTIHTL